MICIPSFYEAEHMKVHRTSLPILGRGTEELPARSTWTGSTNRCKNELLNWQPVGCTRGSLHIRAKYTEILPDFSDQIDTIVMQSPDTVSHVQVLCFFCLLFFGIWFRGDGMDCSFIFSSLGKPPQTKLDLCFRNSSHHGFYTPKGSRN